MALISPLFRPQTLFWIICGALFLFLLIVLGPILTPFILAIVLAYMFSPIVGKLETCKCPRVFAVLCVLLLLCATISGLLLILLPLLADEISLIGARLPQAAALISERLLPWLETRYGLHLQLDAAALKNVLTENWGSLQGLLQNVLQSLKVGGGALIGLIFTLLLTPVVMFYVLLEWDSILEKLDFAIPRPWQADVQRLAHQVDAVLGQFLRGQGLVMLALAIYYSVALFIAGIPSAISLGVLTGLLIFIPYIGFATGLLLALLIATLQFAGPAPVIAVIIVYGIGQILESFLLTPYLVGERIGLHPLAVIFALLAFGQLFGFVGVLIALPASAALLVGLRELRQHYLASAFYRGNKTDGEAKA